MTRPSPDCLAGLSDCVDALVKVSYAIHHENHYLARRPTCEAGAPRCQSRGISVSTFIAKTLDDALKRREAPEPPPFRLVTMRGVHTRPGVDLDRPRALDVQDDEAGYGSR